jgi:hypothetical protein
MIWAAVKIAIVLLVIWLFIRDSKTPRRARERHHDTPDNPFTHGQRIGPITPRD